MSSTAPTKKSYEKRKTLLIIFIFFLMTTFCIIGISYLIKPSAELKLTDGISQFIILSIQEKFPNVDVDYMGRTFWVDISNTHVDHSHIMSQSCNVIKNVTTDRVEVVLYVLDKEWKINVINQELCQTT